MVETNYYDHNLFYEDSQTIKKLCKGKVKPNLRGFTNFNLKAVHENKIKNIPPFKKISVNCLAENEEF